MEAKTERLDMTPSVQNYLDAIPGATATHVTFDHLNNAQVSFRVTDGSNGKQIYGTTVLPVPCGVIEKAGLRAALKEVQDVVSELLLLKIATKVSAEESAKSIGKVVSEVKVEGSNVVSFPAGKAEEKKPTPAAAPAPAPKAEEAPAAPAAKGKKRAAPTPPAPTPPPPPPVEQEAAEPGEEPAHDEPAGDPPQDEFGVDPDEVVSVWGKYKGRKLGDLYRENVEIIRYYANTMHHALPTKEKRALTPEEQLMVEASRIMLKEREDGKR